jgi:hypothetical protein
MSEFQSRFQLLITATSLVLRFSQSVGFFQFNAAACDYRQLNDITQADAYILPRIDQSLEALAGGKYYCITDVKAAFHNVISSVPSPST